MFWRKHETENSGKENINSAEYDTCLKRISELHTELAILKNKLEVAETAISNLRGNFNRKLGIIKEEESKATETLINDNFVAFG